MDQFLRQIEFPELFFGFVSPIGVSIDDSIAAFKLKLESFGYNFVEIRVTDKFEYFSKIVEPIVSLDLETKLSRYKSYISYGNQLREYFQSDDLLALAAIDQISSVRQSFDGNAYDQYAKRAFLIRQFKRKEEVDLMRTVYNRLFFQISIYSRRPRRVSDLSKQFAHGELSADLKKYRSEAEELVLKDENEAAETHGQRVGKIFYDADFIVNSDTDVSVENQIGRFIDLLFGSNQISPTKIEYGMFAAKAAALRTLDLSRQVGAAIFSPASEIICLGSNEVPKAGGGTYWADDSCDAREYVLGSDSNDRRKKEILAEIVKILRPNEELSEILYGKELRDSQFMDALEYGRVVHAEMSAITDAARLGRELRGATLYCTTFPCHMCAKHIIASGIGQVFYLEPYPKSLAFNLHADAINLENEDRGNYKEFPAVDFVHFFGVTPRRYRELFERTQRKNKEDSLFQSFKDGKRRPIVDIYFEAYAQTELLVVRKFRSVIDGANNGAEE
jgi:deoxycytidylate deaminase